MQHFKCIYFADYPAQTVKGRNLSLAFGDDDLGVYQRVQTLSSEDVRQALGFASFASLRSEADIAGVSVNAFCIEKLREWASSGERRTANHNNAISSLDPLHTTFRGGNSEPLHQWYPYLEGYSPEFVNAILSSFAPNAKYVFDPFAGTGTTPLTVARGGNRAAYCELNPFLQILIKTKAEIVSLSAAGKRELAGSVRQLAARVQREVSLISPDPDLAEAYQATFGDSAFFPQHTLESVLRLRAWIDSLQRLNPLEADLATVAVAACLVPASHLIRRGDVRFRKSEAELRLRANDIAVSVAEHLSGISQDIERLESVSDMPSFITADAKKLGNVPLQGFDAVVTSPPYLNGTNYYRNTKLELWFIRALRSDKDLAELRRQTVTAGINDVTVKKNTDPPTESVSRLVEQLATTAYDPRIAQMVSSYFAEMDLVIEGLVAHTKPGGALMLDIGDSAYAGVHVDTPRILTELLEKRGCQIGEEVDLRRRLSRSGLPLHQVLINAKAPVAQLPQPKTPAWTGKWGMFKRDLPHQQGEFSKRNWGHPLHSLCSYQGKMKPALAHYLVGTFASPGSRLLDPFGGVGTIPFEAALNGVRSWSFDISPVAVPVTRAKLGLATVESITAEITNLAEYLEDGATLTEEHQAAGAIRFNGDLRKYFHPDTFDEILLARRYFTEHPALNPASSLVFASLLHVLHGNRPYALSRRSHPITPFAPTGDAEYKSLIEKVRDKINRTKSLNRGPMFTEGSACFHDATAKWPYEIDNLDAVITSPPFFDSTRFYLANWMRLWFAGWTAHDFKRLPGAFVDERQKQSFKVYEPILQQSRERLRSGGVCVLHLGRSRKCDMAEVLRNLALRWFSHAEIFRENVEHCESHGIRDKGSVVEHTFLVLW